MNRPTRALAAALVSAGMLATAPTLAHAAPQRGEAVRPVIGGTSTLARATPSAVDPDGEVVFSIECTANQAKLVAAYPAPPGIRAVTRFAAERQGLDLPIAHVSVKDATDYYSAVLIVLSRVAQAESGPSV